MSKTYQPSGKITLTSILLFLIFCVTVFPLLGGLYTFIIWYIPFIYINFLILGGTAFLVGLIMSRVVVRMGKLRNVKFALLLSVLAGLVTLYASWAVWVNLVLNAGESYGGSRIGITVSSVSISEAIDLAMHPKVLFQLMKEINVFGTWGIRSLTVSGVFLAIIWVIEALGMVAITTFFGFQNAKDPFCEFSNKWFDNSPIQPLMFIDNPDVLIGQLEVGELEELLQLTVVDPTVEAGHSQFNLFSSENDEQYVSITNRKKNVNKDGEIEFEDDALIEYLAITSKVADELRKR